MTNITADEKRTTVKKLLAVMLAVLMIISVSAVWQTDSASAATAKSAKGTYWLKVNAQRGVVTAYKYSGGKWKPVRAMLASVGKAGTPTVYGVYKMGAKYRWKRLGGPSLGGYSYGQYVCTITGSYLFHSVWYYTQSKSNQSYAEFNKLGRPASHGCVRLATIDAKWIYDNCSKGTKITVYRSSNAGPLGKPKALKSHSGWDPTDPTKGNPNFKLRKAVIKIKKSSTAAYGSRYNLKSGVTAKNPNANQDLTGSVKVYSVKKWNSSRGKYVKAKFSTRKMGTYKVTYRVKDPYCRTGIKTFKIKVVDTAAPKITAADRTVAVGSSNAVTGMTAKQASGISRTKAAAVYIKKSGDQSYTKYTYAEAQKYVFDTEDTYSVKYVVKNKYKPYKAAVKTITVTAWKDAEISITDENSGSVTMNVSSAETNIPAAFKKKITVKDKGETIADNSSVTVTGLPAAAPETDTDYTVTVSYKGANGNTVTKDITVKVTIG